MEEKIGLENQLKELREAIGGRGPGADLLASGSDPVTLRYVRPDEPPKKLETNWDAIFLFVAPELMLECSEEKLFGHYCDFVTYESATPTQNGPDFTPPVDVVVDNRDFSRVIYQFLALEYIESVTIVSRGDFETRRVQGYKLTKRGVRTLASKEAVRKPMS